MNTSEQTSEITMNKTTEAKDKTDNTPSWHKLAWWRKHDRMVYEMYIDLLTISNGYEI